MERSTLLDNIADQAAYFAWKVEGRMSAAHYDINIDAEQSFIPILNLVFDVELVNVNKIKKNFPAVDLVDVKKKIAFQITGEVTSDKILETIKKFVDHQLYEQFSTLYIYIITRKGDKYDASAITAATRGKLAFDIKTNIIDFKDLIGRIRYITSNDVLATIEKHYWQMTAFLEPQWERIANIVGVENIGKIPRISDKLKKIGLLQQQIAAKEKEIEIFGRAFKHLHDKRVIEALNESHDKLKKECLHLKKNLEQEKASTDTLTSYIEEQKKLLDQVGRILISERLQKAKEFFDAGEFERVEELLNYEGREEFINKKLEEKRAQTAELLGLADEEVFLALGIMQKDDWQEHVPQIKAHFERSIELGGYGNNSYWYSRFLEDNNENEPALDILRTTLAHLSKDQIIARAQILARMGHLQLSINEEEALKALVAAVGIYSTIYEADAEKYGLDLAENLFYCGLLLEEKDDFDESKDYLDRVLPILTQIKSREDTKARRLEFLTLIKLGYLDQRQGSVENAFSYFSQAMKVSAVLAFDDRKENINFLLEAVDRIRYLMGKGIDTEYTSLLYTKALGHLLEFQKGATAEENRDHARSLSQLGMRLLMAKEERGADICFRNALKIFRILDRKGYPFPSDIAEQLRLVAIRFQLTGNRKRIERYLLEALQLQRELAEADPEQNLSNLALLLGDLYVTYFTGDFHSELSRYDPYFEEALASYKKLDLYYAVPDMGSWMLLLKNRSLFISIGWDEGEPITCYQELNYLKNRIDQGQAMAWEEDIHTIVKNLAEVLLKKISPDHPLFVQVCADIVSAEEYFFKIDPEKNKRSLFASLYKIAYLFKDGQRWKEAIPCFERAIGLANELAPEYPDLEKQFTVGATLHLAIGYLEVQDYSNAAYWFAEQVSYFRNRLVEHPEYTGLLVSTMLFATEAYWMDQQVEMASECLMNVKNYLPLVSDPAARSHVESRIESLNQKVFPELSK